MPLEQCLVLSNDTKAVVTVMARAIVLDIRMLRIEARRTLYLKTQLLITTMYACATAPSSAPFRLLVITLII